MLRATAPPRLRAPGRRESLIVPPAGRSFSLAVMSRAHPGAPKTLILFPNPSIRALDLFSSHFPRLFEQQRQLHGLRRFARRTFLGLLAGAATLHKIANLLVIGIARPGGSFYFFALACH